MSTPVGEGGSLPSKSLSILVGLTLKLDSLCIIVNIVENIFLTGDPAPYFKPDFHSRFSLDASEIFRMGHAQSGETNRTGRKISFARFTFEVQLFQLLRNFFTATPIRLLSLVT